MGRARPLCPDGSHVDLLGYCKSIVHFDAKVPDGTFDFGVAEQELDRSQVARPSINQGRLGSSKRMRSERVRVKADASDPQGDKPCVLSGRHAGPCTSAGE
jgi:hypothetical protein